MLTVGGLFSGIGGLELGLQRAGMRVLWHCEADPFCRRVLERHWPDVPCFADVRGITERELRQWPSRLPVDVLCGGFPCQPISHNGHGLVDADERCPQQILDAIHAKQARNEARVWPDWRSMSADKAIEHDRSHDG